ncbi:MAG: DNA gyrase subunit A [Synechococcales bacterium]|nr:DNA gyrase subunit A [Synechococcales bacterium]
MARQLNIVPSGHVIPTPLHSEVQRSYLEYAMSVIVGRALPDVRDGLKPVHRRILYAMHELGLTPDRPYRKCARVVGDVLGKYHPHGDQAVYDALVRMVQSFSSRYPLLAGHGNFGSVDNDPPAAMRYTETRLAPISNEAALEEIGEATVDFIDNFDNSQQEPLVLPAQLPFLLLNGSSGIAVGMATNIPPHNLGEVVDGLIALIDRPTLPDEKLFELIPGPDFPTGAEITSTKGIREAYTTGRGSIPMRAVAQFEDVQTGRGRHRRSAIVITELPFQVNKASCIEKIAELVNQGRIEGIADIRDESDREGMRIVIELRRDEQPEQILNKLYRLTPLQSNFGVIMLALDNGRPRQMTLRELLQAFLDFRETTLTRQYRHELEQTQGRIHLVAGLLTALENLDEVIEILRNAADGSTAKVELQEAFDLSDRQSDAILAMPLRRLTGLERQKLQTEFDELTERVRVLEQLLSDRHEFLKVLKKDLRALKRKFGDERRTRILSEEEREQEQERLEEIAAEAAAEEETVLEFTQQGYVRRSSPKAFQRRQAKQGEPETHGLEPIEEDVVTQVAKTTTGRELLIFTRSGKAFSITADEIPPTPRNSKGTPVITLLPASAQTGADPEAIATQFMRPVDTDPYDLIVVTQQGRTKRMALSEFTNLTGRGLTVLKLKEDDELLTVMLAKPDDQLVLTSSGGRMLRVRVDDQQMPQMTRTAQGNMAMRLSKREQLAGCVVVDGDDSEVLLVTAQGYAKRMQAREIRLGNRGDLGVQSMRFANKTDRLVGMIAADSGTIVTIFTSADQLAQIPVELASTGDRDSSGSRLLKLPKKETVTSLAIVRPPDDGNGDRDSGTDDED